MTGHFYSRHLAKFPASFTRGREFMPITPRRIVLFISLAVAASFSHAQARSDINSYFTRQATTYNGRQVEQVLEPAVTRLLQSGQLTSEQIKALEKFNAELAKQPNGFGAALEQLAGSQNANLSAATQSTTPRAKNGCSSCQLIGAVSPSNLAYRVLAWSSPVCSGLSGCVMGYTIKNVSA